MKTFLSTILVAALCCSGCVSERQADTQVDFRTLVANGEFAKAGEAIRGLLAQDKTLSDESRREMAFELDRMDRIRLDFRKTRPEVVEFIKKYVPAVTDQDLDRWEKERSLESMTIDGEKRYFFNAARNLFRIDKECLRIWNEQHAEELADAPGGRRPGPRRARQGGPRTGPPREEGLCRAHPGEDPLHAFREARCGPRRRNGPLLDPLSPGDPGTADRYPADDHRSGRLPPGAERRPPAHDLFRKGRRRGPADEVRPRVRLHELRPFTSISTPTRSSPSIRKAP